MIVGFTGTQQGLTAAQARAVYALLLELRPKQIHHGDCVGADADLDGMARHLECRPMIVIHPPTDDQKRAFCSMRTGSPCENDVLEPLPYLVRNRAIVDAADVVIACPKSAAEELRSGTWATVRYARSTGKTLHIVHPTGNVLRDGIAPAVVGLQVRDPDIDLSATRRPHTAAASSDRPDQDRRREQTMTHDPQALLQRFQSAGVKPVDQRYPFIQAGQHLLILAEIRPFENKDKHPCYAADFMVKESTCHAPGTFVTQTFDTVRPSKFASQATDLDRFGNLMCQLDGVPVNQHEVQRLAAAMISHDGIARQPARGVLVRANGSPTKSSYVNVVFEHVPGAKDQIAPNRAHLDQVSPLNQRNAPAAAPAPAPQQYQAAPQGWPQQPPGYPPPAAAAPAPQGPPPGYGYPPAPQQGYPAQYQQAPVGYPPAAPAPQQPAQPPYPGAVLPPGFGGQR